MSRRQLGVFDLIEKRHEATASLQGRVPRPARPRLSLAFWNVCNPGDPWDPCCLGSSPHRHILPAVPGTAAAAASEPHHKPLWIPWKCPSMNRAASGPLWESWNRAIPHVFMSTFIHTFTHPATTRAESWGRQQISRRVLVVICGPPVAGRGEVCPWALQARSASGSSRGCVFWRM